MPQLRLSVQYAYIDLLHFVAERCFTSNALFWLGMLCAALPAYGSL
jgi:hypothetical protein